MFALKLVIAGAIVAFVSAQALETTKTAQIVTEKSFVSADGYSFKLRTTAHYYGNTGWGYCDIGITPWGFETSDGVSRQEDAHLITVGDHQGIGVKGSYSYYAPDGQQYIVTFTADDKGYKPQIRIAPQNN